MISFRLSDHEFERLKTTSEAQGARSVSDYARLALSGFTSAPDDRLETDIQQLNGEVQQLRGDIRRLMELLEAARQSVSSPTAFSSNHKASFGNA
jgi:outer membrane murein-binding lipoprotein Lpp